MTDYGASDTSTTTLGANQFPISEAWVPNAALTAVEGIAVNTDSGGKKSTAVRMGLKDGDDVTLGLTTQTKATDGSTTSWSAIQLLKGILDKLINGNVPVSGTVTETNSAAILAALDDGQENMASSISVVIASDQSAVPVSGTFWQGTQPVSGTVTANQGGTWTVQPGNTANTTPWLASIHDGTTKANVTTSTGANANGAALLSAGAYQEIAGAGTGTVTGTNTDFIPSTDVSAYPCMILQTSGTWTLTLTAQVSNDNATWASAACIKQSTGTNTSTLTSNDSLIIPRQGRYLRVRCTAFTSNASLAGNLEAYTYGTAFTVLASEAGTWTVQPGNVQNTTPWLVSQGPPADLTLIASAAFTTTQTTADQTNFSGKGIRVVLDVTNAGTGSVTLEIDSKDVASAKYSALLTGVAVTTNSTNVYVIHPELTAAANSIAKDVLPHTWRVKVTANNANSVTYSVGSSYLT